MTDGSLLQFIDNIYVFYLYLIFY